MTVLLATFHCISNVKKMYIFAVCLALDFQSFGCFYCDKKFANKIQVENHEKLHAGEKTYSDDVSNSHGLKEYEKKEKLGVVLGSIFQ